MRILVHPMCRVLRGSVGHAGAVHFTTVADVVGTLTDWLFFPVVVDEEFERIDGLLRGVELKPLS